MDLLRLAAKLPEPIKRPLRGIKSHLVSKNDAELSFWKSRHAIDGGRFSNAHYKSMMLAMAGEHDQQFLSDRVVADFGCGPRGSLVWADAALLRIGIDVLADRYADAFPEDITSHRMIYVKATEQIIPLPSGSVDVVFTLNAMDHVNDFPQMCREVRRVLKPGGLFIGSFNLGEPPSPCEPQQLDEATVEAHMLAGFEIQRHVVSGMPAEGGRYDALLRGEALPMAPGSEGTLWVRARKPETA